MFVSEQIQSPGVKTLQADEFKIKGTTESLEC